MKKQIENRCKKFTATLLASLMIVGTPLLFPDKAKLNAAVDGDGTPEYNESYVNKTSLSGRAPAFNYETLMNWSPDKDPDAWINRSTEPLAPRFKGVQINPKAHPEARILNCGLALWSHDLASSTGSSDFEVYAFDNWQLIDTFVFWSGTDEGIFAIPSPDVITAAHKNGVKVHALLGFPWGGQPEGVAEMRRMYQQADDGSYPAGDKMIEIAYHFNFDGYFFNQESYGGNPDDTTKLAGLMRYIRDKSSKMGKLVEMSWYDAMANHGNVSHQNAVNGENDYWIKPQNSSNDYAVDQFFMNYNWGPSHINTTVNTMRANNRSPFDAYAGMEVQQNSYDTNVYTGGLLDNNGQPRVSIALFAPNSTMGKASSPETFHKEEEMFYTGPEGDPSLSADNSKWRGMARFVTDSSVIQGDNFHTSFNAGHGKNWFDKGTLIRQQTWNNRSIQDIMPTWRWWVRDLAGSRINVSYDFDDAWNGGNSLLFNGDLTANSYNNVMLYSTRLNVKDSTCVDITFKAKAGAEVSLGISYQADYRNNEMNKYSLGEATGEWQTKRINLADKAGETVHAISLIFENSEDVNDFEFNLGEINYNQGAADKLEAPKNAHIDESLMLNLEKAEARLSWDKLDGAKSYNVYQEKSNGELEYLVSSNGSNPNIYVPNITRNLEEDNDIDYTNILIKAVNADGVEGEPAKVKYVWQLNKNDGQLQKEYNYPNVALNAEIIGMSGENAAEPAHKALDGTSANNSKWCHSNWDNGYLEIRLDKPRSVQRWRMELGEYGGEAKNTNAHDFELQMRDANNNWVTVHRITNNKSAFTDVILDKPYTAQEWKLVINDAGSSPWGAVRIYEWQMFESDTKPTIDNVSPQSVWADVNEDGNGKVTFLEIPKGYKVNLYDNLSDEQPIASSDISGETGKLVIENIDFNSLNNKDNKIFYELEYEGEISPRMSTSYVLPESSNLTIIASGKNSANLNNVKFDIFKRGSDEKVASYETGANQTVELPSGNYTIKNIDVGSNGGYLADPMPKDVFLKSGEENTVKFNIPSIQVYFDLEDLIEEKTNELENQTDAEKDALQNAINKANEISQNFGNNEVKLLAAYNELKNFKFEDSQELDKSKLEALVEKAEQLEASEYTETSWNDLTEKLVAAKSILERTDVNQEQINSAHDELQDALDKLVKNVETANNIVLKKTVLSSLSYTAQGTEVSTSIEGEETDKAIDGSTETKWCGGDNTASGWFVVDLGDDYVFDSAKFINAAAFEGDGNPTINTDSAEIQVLKNLDLDADDLKNVEIAKLDENWQKIGSFSNNTENEVSFDLAKDVAARYIRIFVKDSGSYRWRAIRQYEVEVYGESIDLGDKSELETKYNELKDLDSKLYTKDTYAELNSALENAKIVLDNPLATTEDVEKALDRLNSSFTALKRRIKLVFDYNYEGGPDPVVMEIAEGDLLGPLVPETPSRDGYKFKGWFTSEHVEAVFTTYVKENTTYYANWEEKDPSSEPEVENIVLNKKILSTWAQNTLGTELINPVEGEEAEKAIDGKLDTKWCAGDNTVNGSIVIDLGKEYKLESALFVNAGEFEGEGDSNINTAAAQIQILNNKDLTAEDLEDLNIAKLDSNWTTVGEFTGNKDNETSFDLNTDESVRFIRINILDSGNYRWKAIRQYEVEVFGYESKPVQNYKVEFNLNYENAPEIASKNVVENSLLKDALPEEPVRDGYKFLRWTLDGLELNGDETVNKDIVLVAEWEKLPDYTELRNLVEQAKEIKADGYTEESFANLLDEIAKAEKFLNDETVSQEDLDKAVAKLNEAIDGLEEVIYQLTTKGEVAQMLNAKVLEHNLVLDQDLFIVFAERPNNAIETEEYTFNEIYDIRLENAEGEEVKANGTVKLAFTPKTNVSDNTVLIHETEAGLVELNFEKEGNGISFTTDSFSNFGLAVKSEEKPTEPSKPDESEKPTEPSKPDESEKPTEPSKPDESEKPSEPGKPSVSDGGDQSSNPDKGNTKDSSNSSPTKTGVAMNIAPYLLTIVLLTAAFVIVVVRRKLDGKK